MYHFIKAHALGNDFVIFQNISFDDIADKASFIADRHKGIGCDQVICVNNGFAKFWNSDGSSASFCGNGSRCLARCLEEKGEISFLTDSGKVTAVVRGKSVKIRYPCMPKMIQKNDNFCKIDVGNKHIVIFGSSRLNDWSEVIKKYRCDGYNIMHLYGNWMDCYEFGVGPTTSCGSGAMAAAFAISDRSNSQRPVTIISKGGSLFMEFEMGGVYQTGDTELVFKGEIDL